MNVDLRGRQRHGRMSGQTARMLALLVICVGFCTGCTPHLRGMDAETYLAYYGAEERQVYLFDAYHGFLWMVDVDTYLSDINPKDRGREQRSGTVYSCSRYFRTDRATRRCCGRWSGCVRSNSKAAQDVLDRIYSILWSWPSGLGRPAPFVVRGDINRELVNPDHVAFVSERQNDRKVAYLLLAEQSMKQMSKLKAGQPAAARRVDLPQPMTLKQVMEKRPWATDGEGAKAVEETEKGHSE